MDRRQPHIHDVVVVLKTDDELLHCRFKSDYVELSPAFPLKDTERDLPLHQRFLPNLTAAALAVRRPLKDVIGSGSLMAGNFVENPIKRYFRFPVAGFAGGNLAFELGNRGLADEYDADLVNGRIEEFVEHGPTLTRGCVFGNESHSQLPPSFPCLNIIRHR